MKDNINKGGVNYVSSYYWVWNPGRNDADDLEEKRQLQHFVLLCFLSLARSYADLEQKTS